MDKEKIEVIKWKLSELANSEPENIESNDLEIMGEDDQGRDGYSTVQITDLANEALELFEDLQRVVQMCFDDACKPSGKISKKTAIELMKYADTRA